MSSASQPSAAGELVAGRYRVEASLGRGGVGEVLRVCDTSLGKSLALKRLRADASSELRSLFEREYQTLASLRHPNTVEVYEYGREGDALFYTMELLEGRDLREQAPMPWPQACAALRDAAVALTLLHARGLVHRDVSPRNLWRSPDGRVKLIDFGAVVPFGRPARLIGTPPLIPPEALHGFVLDQRADLYALGAVGYYLLSGRNAYVAREIADLPALWKYPPLPPSAIVELLTDRGLEPIPAELDALLMALLRQNPLARPSSSAEVIDQLDALLGRTSMPHSEAPESQLANVAFVGRERELRRLRRQLTLAANAKGQSAWVEAEAGMGRSRLLHETGLIARVADTCVLQVDAASYPGAYGLANALALRLLDALPQAARAAAQRKAATLALVSPALRARLGASQEKVPDAAGELRVRIQTALCDWFLELAAVQTLVLLVDGIEHADDGSVAFLLQLAQRSESARIFLVAAHLRSRERQTSATRRALSQASRRLRLSGLSEAASVELLRSVFGRAEHLPRLAARLHTVARGSPGQMLALLAELMRASTIRLADGNTWVLPQELPEGLSSSSLKQVFAARLERLAPEARALARRLSVREGVISAGVFDALADGASADSLIEQEILARDADGLRFVHEEYRARSYAELSPEAKRAAFAALGKYLLAEPGSGPLERLSAAVQLLESGDRAAIRLVTETVAHITLHEPDRLAPAVPAIERALLLFRAANRPQVELAVLFGALAVAGYFVDRKYAAQYGELALTTLHDVLGLGLARKLQRRLGGRLGLIGALLATAARFTFRARTVAAPSFVDALTLLFMSVSALAASSGLCYDYASTRRAAATLEPFAAFGARYAPGFAYEVCCGLATAVRDTFGESHARWQRVVAVLESKQLIFGLPSHLRVRYLSGLICAMGIMDSQRDDERSLRSADRLDAMGVAIFPMSTEQLRAMYYAHHGDAQRYAHYRECAEQRAIQQGAIWQNETWALLVETVVRLRHHDAMGMKLVSEQLRSASAIIPSLSVFADRSHGAYLLLRGRAAQALPWLERCLSEEPRANFGWGRSHGVLARAYNQLGRYADARAACARVLAEFSAEDLAFPGLTLVIETELLVAEAGLGEHARARAGLERLFEQHRAQRGPLTIAELCEAGLRIALLSGDHAVARTHCAEMVSRYEATGISTLIQHAQELRTETQVQLGEQPVHSLRRSLGTPGMQMHTFENSAFSVDGASLSDLAQRGLRLMLADQSAEQGFLYWVRDEVCTAAAALAPEPIDARVEAWVRARVREESVDVPTVVLSEKSALPATTRDVLTLGTRVFRLTMLYDAGDGRHGVVGVAVAAADGGAPVRCSPQVLELVASQLQRGLKHHRTDSTTA